MKKKTFPPGWDEDRVTRVLEHYESQTEEEALAEDEAAFKPSDQTIMKVQTEISRMTSFKKHWNMFSIRTLICIGG